MSDEHKFNFSEEELSTAINRMGGIYSGMSLAPENSPTVPKRMADAAAGEQMLDLYPPGCPAQHAQVACVSEAGRPDEESPLWAPRQWYFLGKALRGADA